jgi:hypothetical protein
MKYKLYITINKLNGKLYAGKRYWTPGTSYMGSGLALKKAIEKYGRENFEVRWFKFHIDTPSDLERLEIKLIKRLRNKFGRERCYNMSNGGRGGCYRSDADDERKKEVGELVSIGKRKQYENGVTEKQLEGRKKMKETKKRLYQDLDFYNRVHIEGGKKRVSSLKKRREEQGPTQKEIDRHKDLIKYSTKIINYRLSFPDGSNRTETKTVNEFMETYKTDWNIFTVARKEGKFIFKRRTSMTRHPFPPKTELSIIEETKACDV